MRPHQAGSFLAVTNTLPVIGTTVAATVATLQNSDNVFAAVLATQIADDAAKGPTGPRGRRGSGARVVPVDTSVTGLMSSLKSQNAAAAVPDIVADMATSKGPMTGSTLVTQMESVAFTKGNVVSGDIKV